MINLIKCLDLFNFSLIGLLIRSLFSFLVTFIIQVIIIFQRLLQIISPFHFSVIGYFHPI